MASMLRSAQVTTDTSGNINVAMNTQGQRLGDLFERDQIINAAVDLVERANKTTIETFGQLTKDNMAEWFDISNQHFQRFTDAIQVIGNKLTY